MAVERGGVELRQYGNFLDIGVETVAHGNIDETVLSRQWNGRFRALFRKGIESSSLSTAQNET
jgi:hypothetical protein